jgi:LuxR family transcriptional regulator, maltose regulon positive regulatory protein
VIEILLLKALAMQEIGDSEHSILTLTKCLTLAEPEGYVRIFLDESRLMQILLLQWLARAEAGPLRDYLSHLLYQFDDKPHGVKALPEKSSPAADLIEPLSKRELEVLQLLALGQTNRQIAQQLVVAAGTVKAHTASIYRKLDAANRTQAVGRARQLGILL